MKLASPNLKGTGAYYTADPVADFLTRWAVRKPTDRVLDPSFGGGVFLQAAVRRACDLGGNGSLVHGIELGRTDIQRSAIADWWS